MNRPNVLGRIVEADGVVHYDLDATTPHAMVMVEILKNQPHRQSREHSNS
jgi:hypothetical protein